jgi:hypothetical protein
MAPARPDSSTADSRTEPCPESGRTGLLMTAVRKRGQNPYFWYRPMCLALCAKVNSPAWRVPHASNSSMVASSRRWPMARSQYSGATVSGPKKPTLPQFAAKFDPTRRPPTSAASAAPGAACQRVRTMSASPKKLSG